MEKNKRKNRRRSRAKNLKFSRGEKVDTFHPNRRSTSCISDKERHSNIFTIPGICIVFRKIFDNWEKEIERENECRTR